MGASGSESSDRGSLEGPANEDVDSHALASGVGCFDLEASCISLFSSTESDEEDVAFDNSNVAVASCFESSHSFIFADEEPSKHTEKDDRENGNDYQTLHPSVSSVTHV